MQRTEGLFLGHCGNCMVEAHFSTQVLEITTMSVSYTNLSYQVQYCILFVGSAYLPLRSNQGSPVEEQSLSRLLRQHT